MTDVLDELHWRGLVAQTTDEAALRDALSEGPIAYYCGFDPTAPSLHHGHLVQLILLRHLQRAGHRAVALVGGATGMIGDPRQSGERVLNTKETVAEWTERLKAQISRFLDFDGDNPAVLVNNLDWIDGMSAIDFLRDVGKHYRLGTMLAKDTVARRLSSDEGISFTEFSYQILQGIDFLELYRRHGVTLQTGGNDQWGNLLSGVELVRRSEGETVHVMTTPLITKADGTKFGKTEGGAVWLAPDLMSPYAFYQYWLNVEDDSVVKLLKIFTDRTREELEDLERQVAEEPFRRTAQRTLAADVTTLVHGEEATVSVQAASEALFGKGDLAALEEQTLLDATQELPGADVPAGTGLLDALVATGLVDSKKAARRAIGDGSVSINGDKVADEGYAMSPGDYLHGRVAVLRRGRKNLAAARAS